MRIAVVGKGGSGKSLVAATLARVLARRGERVLALDSDMQPGLSVSLGATAPPAPPLMAAAERGDDGRWRLRRGIGPVRAVQRFATPAPDGVLLLQAGKPGTEGVQAIMPSLQAFWRVIHRLDRPAALRGWVIIGDLPAGPRQLAYDWAPYAERLLLVVEPTVQSLLTARRVLRVAGDRPVDLVANKVAGAGDRARIEDALGRPPLATVPRDEAVREAERSGAALLDASPAAPAVRAIELLADRLRSGTVAP